MVIVDGKDLFYWILLVKTSISVTKCELKSVVDSLEKKDCAHVSRLFGQFNLWMFLETSNVCQLRNILKKNGVGVYWS